MVREAPVWAGESQTSSTSSTLRAALLLLVALRPGPAAAAPLFTVSADAASIHLEPNAPAPAGAVALHAVAVHEAGPDAGNRVARFGPGPLTLPRFHGGRDLLYRRFVAVDAAGEPLGGGAFVTGLSGLPRLTADIPWPASIKGVSNPVGPEQDLLDLGVKHVHLNFCLNDLLLPAGAPDPPAAFRLRVDGLTVRLDPSVVAAWDRRVRPLTEAGVNVVAVVLNRRPGPGRNADLLHPRSGSSRSGGRHRFGAFNTTDRRGVASFVGALGFLARRYGDPGSGRGLIGGYVIGNEVDAHGAWHDLGPASAEEVIAHHAGELRLAWLAVRGASASPRVFTSLTHSWTRPHTADPLASLPGRRLLGGLTAASRAGGDFGWGVAHHPYPQQLPDPRFWEDELAVFAFDSPMITYRNLELLPAWLRLGRNLVGGEPRRVILSEQGLHTPAGPGGERLQAAALALAHHRVERTGGIDAHILHRHVDHPGEGGLRLGLRRAAPQADGSAPYGAKKRSWFVFRAAGTPAFEREAAFALAHAGYADWSEADPRPGPFPERADPAGPDAPGVAPRARR